MRMSRKTNIASEMALEKASHLTVNVQNVGGNFSIFNKGVVKTEHPSN